MVWLNKTNSFRYYKWGLQYVKIKQTKELGSRRLTNEESTQWNETQTIDPVVSSFRVYHCFGSIPISVTSVFLDQNSKDTFTDSVHEHDGFRTNKTFDSVWESLL